MEIQSGPPGPDAEIIETEPDAEISPHTRNLIDARNHLIETGHAARTWAVENPDHPVSHLLTRTDVGEQTKIQALKRIETVSLPDVVNELLDAARNFNDRQAEAQAEFDTESQEAETEFSPDGNRDIFEGLRSAYLNLLRGYRNWGGFGYHGWTNRADSESYVGPAVWTRQDCVFRFGRALEREFPDRVHLGLKISKAMTSSFDAEVDRRQTVDLTVTIPGLFTREMSQQRFRNLRHDLFVEVQWLKKGRWMNTDQLVKRCSRIQQNLINLQRSIDSGRCEYAAMLIVDDEGFLDFHGGLLRWPPDVIPLVVSPRTIVEQNLGNGEFESVLREIEHVHHMHCPCQETPLAL